MPADASDSAVVRQHLPERVSRPEPELVDVGPTREFELFSATRDGMIKKTPATEYRSAMRNGKIAMSMVGDYKLQVTDKTGTSSASAWSTTSRRSSCG